MKYCIAALIGYLLGSLNVSVMLSTHFEDGDVRKKGSGNAGATNMARVYGLQAGLLTLAGDMLKTFAAVTVGRLLAGDAGLLCAGAACMLGHCWPVFHAFRGGKGASVGAMTALLIDGRVFLAAAAVFFLIALTTKKVSVGSTCAALTLALTALILPLGWERAVLGIIIGAIVVFQHRENIKRLLNGTEPDFKAAKRR